MKTTYYHKNSEVVAFEKFKDSKGVSYEITYDDKGNILTYKDSDGYSYERTYDDKGNELTYKNSDGYFSIKCKEVSKQELENFVNRPCVGKKVIVDGVEYELK